MNKFGQTIKLVCNTNVKTILINEVKYIPRVIDFHKILYKNDVIKKILKISVATDRAQNINWFSSSKIGTI